MISPAVTAAFQDWDTRKHGMVTWLLVAGLLVLRFPLVTGAALFFKAQSSWADALFQVGTYVLTAVLIWWERRRLADFHIDRLAILIILLLKPLQMIFLMTRRDGHAFPFWGMVTIWTTAIALFIVLRGSRPNLPRLRAASVKWFVVGAGTGVLTAIVLGYPTSLQLNTIQIPASPGLPMFLFDAAFDFVYQLGYAAVSEEPLFRGFLWGCLRKAGWREIWIWLFQSGLFMLGHLYYLHKYDVSFYVIIPLGALVYGFVAWRSRSIAASMAAHAAHNALGFSLAAFFARL